MKIKKTHEEMVKSYKQGYEIFIIKACLCLVTSNPYEDYIKTAYNRRVESKKKMKE